MHERVRRKDNRAEVAVAVGGRARLPRREPRAGRRARGALLHARDAAVPVRQPAHGARPELHDGRRRHALQAPPRVQGVAADGLRLVRPAGRERSDQGRRSPARDHRAQHGGDPQPDAPHGLGDRLAARGVRARADLLPLDAVAVPEVLRARARLPQGGAGQLVPVRPDRARERARRRRALLALRQHRRDAEHGAVVLQDHAYADALLDDLATIDWPERTKKIQTQWIGRSEGAEVLFRVDELDLDIPVFTTRPDTLFGATFFVVAPESPLLAAARRRDGAGRRGARVRARRRRTADRGARAAREERRLHRPLRDEPGQRRARSRSGSPTTC